MTLYIGTPCFIHFTLLSFIDTAVFTNWRFVATLCHFSNNVCSLCISVSHFGNSHNISNIFIIIFVWWSAISDLWCYYWNCFGMPWTVSIKDGKLNWLMCVLTVPQTSYSPISLPLLRPSYYLRHNNTEIRTINRPQSPLSVPVKGRVIHLSL